MVCQFIHQGIFNVHVIMCRQSSQFLKPGHEIGYSLIISYTVNTLRLSSGFSSTLLLNGVYVSCIQEAT